MRRLLILFVFLISGAAGLIYQVVWMRQLTLILGVTSQAVSTVLAVFMGGLALGSWLFGKRVDRSLRPLRLYGYLELGIAMLGALSLVILRAMLATYGDLRHLSGDFFPVVRVVLACVAILAPTTLMGATLPVLIRGACRSRERIARESGLLYGINTIGAVLGTLASAFFLVEALGVRGTTIVAVGINLFAGGMALWLSSREDQLPVEEAVSTAPREVSDTERRTGRVVLFAFGVSGFLALAYEVLWTRYLIYVINENSVFAFATMLAAFLIGIALGSLLAALIVDRVERRVALLGGIFVLLGAAAAGTVTLMGLLHSGQSGRFGGGETFWAQTAGQFLRSLGVLIVPTTLSGMTFAIVARIYARDLTSLGADAGRAYAINTLGAIFGALVGGFFLLPHLGLIGGIAALAAVNVGLGLWLLLRGGPGSRSPRTAAVTSGIAVLAFAAIPLWAKTPEDLISEAAWSSGSEIVYYSDGPESSVAVEKSKDGSLHILVDGEGQAGTSTRMQIHLRLLGHLPVIFHPDPKQVLVVAFGAGVTTGSALQHPISHLDQVELNPKVILESSVFFEAENHDPVHDPKFTAIFDDGRNYLLATDKQYDVITSDPIDPNDRGTTSLYCKEYYELVAEHLNDGGLACQWITTGYGKADFDMLVRSFQSVFDHTAVFFADFTTVVVGFKGEPRMTLAGLRAKFELPKVRASLGRVGIDSAEMLMAMMLTGPDATREMIWSGDPEKDVLNTDDRPRIEYYRADGGGWDRAGEWKALLAGRSPDHSDWLADWSAEDQAACAEAYGWMDVHFERTLAEVTRERKSEGREGADKESMEEPPELTPEERDARYLSRSAKREARGLKSLRLFWQTLGSDVDRVMLIMSGLDEVEPKETATAEQRALYADGLAAGLAAFERRDFVAASTSFEAVAAAVPGATRAALLAAGSRAEAGDAIGALETTLAFAEQDERGFGSPFGVAKQLLPAVFQAMDAAEPVAARALGQRLLGLTPDEADCPTERPRRGPWEGVAKHEDWPPRARPSGAALGHGDAWRLWWRDANGSIRVMPGRLAWRTSLNADG